MGDGRDLASLAVPAAGELIAVNDRYEPFRMTGPDGMTVEPVTEFFRDLLAAGRSEATVRSYGMDLLRWFRFTWAAGIAWDRADQRDARDFSRWLQLSGRGGKGYAPAVRAHSETVLRGFYAYHLEAGTGPVINPFPLDRARRRGRSGAHHNPMENYPEQRSGRYRPRLPSRVPKAVSDEEFNAIFARLPSNRDRALVAFYVSTGARASELLSATAGGTDPGRQLITVVRKGTRELAQLPASPDAFVWLRLYQAEMGTLIPPGRRQPLWWTLRRPVRPLSYHAAHRMFERVNQQAGTAATLHALRHTAAFRMADDPSLPLTDVQAVLGHAPADHDSDLHDAPGGGRDPPGAGPSRRDRTAGGRAVRARPGLRLPARDAGRAVRDRGIMTVRLHKELQGEVPAPVRLRREARQAAWDASRTGFPARPDPVDWPVTHLAHEPVLGLITRPPFTLPNPGTRNMQARGAGLALDWLAGFPGGTWQQRWHASGAEDAGAGWKQDCAGWMDARGVHAGNRMDELSIGLILAVCADIVRPGLPWLAASGVSPGALARNLERTRDHAGLSGCGRPSATTGPSRSGRGTRPSGGPRSSWPPRAARSPRSSAGDFLELLDAEREARSRTRDYSAVSWRLLRQAGAFGPRSPESLAQLLTVGQRSPAELVDRYQLACRPVRDLIVDYLQERQPALDYRSLDTLAQQLARNFWADLEHHHPGIASLNLPPAVAAAWKQRMRTRPGGTRTSPTASGWPAATP